MPFNADAATAELPVNELPAESRRTHAPEFPGCHPFPLKREDLDSFDGRFEYWDGDTETAWRVSEPTGYTHERPSQRLAALVELIAQSRGSPIECCGTMDLLLRNARGEKWRIMQADQAVYLHPGRIRLPTEAMEIGWHDRPDVVLEVDHTTDVRRGKLGLYEEWGFPEMWVNVPEAGYVPSRPAGLSPGLTIHVLEDGGYRTVTESRAFPGWTAAEIHTAMNEASLSMETSRVLRRVGRALGAREGTRPGAPWLRMERREAHAQGHAEGRVEGRAEGQRAMLVRQAARRFDAGTAERLSALLARIDDPARLAEVGDRIVDCATGADLLDRVEGLDTRA